jgi:hypothetical protein
VAFRKKLYTSIEELQADLDLWIVQYNNERTHSGKYCFGKTPMDTFISSKHLALEKRLDELLENITFNQSGETESGSAEEQPARDNLILGNNKVVEQSATSSENYFSSNA